jgi:ATP-dependent Clp protease ATP-binding subunit ClpB
MEKHTVSRLVGAPPGYVGFEEGGQLTEAVRRKPYSVVLLDEIEKAHQDVFNVLLQILEDGRLTDSHGRTVSFKNTIVIMTSNIGSTHLLGGIDRDGHISEEARQTVEAALRAHFRPEFLNRVDETVLFKPLTLGEITSIVGLLIKEFGQRLEQQRIELSVTEQAEKYIAEAGYDPVYGARPLKRYILQHLETPISRLIISGQKSDGSVIAVDVDENGLTLN